MFFISQLSKFLEGTAYSTSVTNDSHAYYCLLIDLAFPSLHVERLGVSTFRTLHVRGRRVTRNIALNGSYKDYLTNYDVCRKI